MVRTLGLAAVNAALSRRLRQVDDPIHPVPGATLIGPELGQQSRLIAVVGTSTRAAEQDEASVTFSRAEYLTGMPRKRCPIECHEHQTGLCAGH